MISESEYQALEKKVYDKFGDELNESFEYGFIDTIVVMVKIVFWLIFLGIAIPLAVWVGRKIYISAKKTRAEVKR